MRREEMQPKRELERDGVRKKWKNEWIWKQANTKEKNTPIEVDYAQLLSTLCNANGCDDA